MKLIIEIPDKMYKTVQDGTYCGSLYEELKNGIPVEQCGDCISREEMWKAYHKMIDSGNTVDVYDAIKNLPPVTPQQKMGRWAVLKDEYGDVIEDVCSNCDKNGNRKWAFCPFCGCKMQEVEND